MIRAERLAGKYALTLRLVDFGAWTDGELRAEYDPTAGEIRINRRLAESLPPGERQHFIDLAIGHELYHHRERIGEVAKLSTKCQREAAADAFAQALSNEPASK